MCQALGLPPLYDDPSPVCSLQPARLVHSPSAAAHATAQQPSAPPAVQAPAQGARFRAWEGAAPGIDPLGDRLDQHSAQTAVVEAGGSMHGARQHAADTLPAHATGGAAPQPAAEPSQAQPLVVQPSNAKVATTGVTDRTNYASRKEGAKVLAANPCAAHLELPCFTKTSVLTACTASCTFLVSEACFNPHPFCVWVL
jgi:hypothetical protein